MKAWMFDAFGAMPPWAQVTVIGGMLIGSLFLLLAVLGRLGEGSAPRGKRRRPAVLEPWHREPSGEFAIVKARPARHRAMEDEDTRYVRWAGWRGTASVRDRWTDHRAGGKFGDL